MNIKQLKSLASGIVVGLKKAKELFRESTDAKGGCKMLSLGNACKCFLCLIDAEIERVEKEVNQ